MCIDYWLLNKVTISDNCPMPDLEARMRRLQKAMRYVALDLQSGYNNMVVDPASWKFTGFVTQDCMYVFERLSFGFKNAPAYFQRCVQTIVDKRGM